MKIEVKQIEELVREVNVAVAPEAVKEEMDKKFGELRKTVTLKGFRKGKAPMETIRSSYFDQVQSEVVDELIRGTLPGAVREKELNVSSPPTVTDIQFSDEGGFDYTARVEVFPVIDKVSVDKLEVSEHKSEVTDQEVNDFTESMLKKAATFRTLERAATASDIVRADLKKVLDPNLALDKDEFPDSILDLSSPMTVKEFREQLVGAKAGDEKEIKVTYDKDYTDKRFAGSTITFSVRVKEVQERIIPELNDGFARTTGQAETALELKLKIREEIKRQKDEYVRKAQRSHLIEGLCKENPVTVPEGLVTDYLDRVVEEMKSNEGNEGDIDEGKVRGEYRQLGEVTIRWGMLMHKLAEQERIEVLPADTENLIKSFAAGNDVSEEQAKQFLSSKERIAGIRESILEEKVVDFLRSRAKIVPDGTKK